jgi:hypothetical protein
VSLRRDQLIPVNKAVNEKEQLEKGAGGGGEKIYLKNVIIPKSADRRRRGQADGGGPRNTETKSLRPRVAAAEAHPRSSVDGR